MTGPQRIQRKRTGRCLMTRLLARLADLLLGEFCPRGCGERVWPKDYCSHKYSCPNSPHRKDRP